MGIARNFYLVGSFSNVGQWTRVALKVTATLTATTSALTVQGRWAKNCSPRFKPLLSSREGEYPDNSHFTEEEIEVQRG